MRRLDVRVCRPARWKGRLRSRAGRIGEILLLVYLIFCALIFPAYGSEAQAGDDAASSMMTERTSPVTMEVEYGYDNTAKGGRYLPLSVTLKNRGEQALAAVLRIKSEESDQTVFQYEYPVTVDAGTDEETRYYIPLGTNADRLFLTLTDEDGNTILTQTVSLKVSRDVPELFIGLLSDDPDQLSYLDGVGIRYSTLRTRAFALDEGDFPEDEVGLDLLDVLVVNDYKLRNLSEIQTAAIMDWVHSGGVLILGTGERVDDTLGRFAPELLDDSYGTPSLRHINLGENYTLDRTSDGMLAISCVDIPLHGGNVILSSGGLPLLTAAAKEQGLIAVAGFDLGDIAEFCEENSGYVDYMFTTLMGESRINRLAEMVYSGNSSGFWSVQSLINTGDVEKLPKLGAYVAVVLVYLALLGPGLYLFLLHRELQIFYRRGVAVLAVIFGVTIYLMGIPTRFRSVFFTYAAIQDVTDDYVNDTTYINIRNPYNRPYVVELDPAYSLLPITRSANDASSIFSEDSENQIVISYGEDATTVQGQNIAAFAPRYFRLERKQENTDKIGITGEVNYFEGRISGYLTNNFPYPLENTALILYGTMMQIGRMEVGETRDLGELELLRFPLGDSYVIAEWISGEKDNRTGDIHDSQYLLAMERSNMLKFYLDTYLSGYTADGRVLAFSPEKEETQFLKSNAAETYGLTMLTASIAVNASRDSSVYRSALMKTPVVIAGSYDASSNSMRGTGPLTLEYQFGEDIEVEGITFETVSEVFLEDENDMEVFEGNIYFYNYTTGNFDRMDPGSETMDVEELQPYLSPANTMTVRYVYDGVGSYGQIQLPMPMVAGREK
ncbi:MAG: hypothetical protein LUE86_05385 [Clostridiales bacterium]|nr:hypothetical protein [Clostridiales bacterium]